MRTEWRKLWALIFGDAVPEPVAGVGSIRSRLAPPHTFSPNLGLGKALIAVLASLTRIFGGCLLFAVIGGCGLVAWNRIENLFWRVAAVALLTVLLTAAIATLMVAVAVAERAIARKA
jgi:hypothetical protein